MTQALVSRVACVTSISLGHRSLHAGRQVVTNSADEEYRQGDKMPFRVARIMALPGASIIDRSPPMSVPSLISMILTPNVWQVSLKDYYR